MVRGRTSNQSIQAFPKDHLFPQSSFSSTSGFFSPPFNNNTQGQQHPATSTTLPDLLWEKVKRRIANSWSQLQERHLSGETEMQWPSMTQKPNSSTSIDIDTVHCALLHFRMALSSSPQLWYDGLESSMTENSASRHMLIERLLQPPEHFRGPPD